MSSRHLRCNLPLLTFSGVPSLNLLTLHQMKSRRHPRFAIGTKNKFEKIKSCPTIKKLFFLPIPTRQSLPFEGSQLAALIGSGLWQPGPAKRVSFSSRESLRQLSLNESQKNPIFLPQRNCCRCTFAASRKIYGAEIMARKIMARKNKLMTKEDANNENQGPASFFPT